MQIHKHARTCYKKGGTCRFNFPKYPSEETIVAQPLERNEFTLNAVKCALNELKEDEYNSISLDEIIKKAGILKSDYNAALCVSTRGTVIVLKRTIREIFVNKYNAEWLNVWNADRDTQVCLDYFGVMTYITDNYPKDESGTMPFLINALKECTGKQHSEMLRVIANTFLTQRLKGKSEVLYGIDLQCCKDSNIKTVWVDCNIPCNRRKFLRKIADDSDSHSDKPQCDNESSENEGNVHEQYNNSGIICIPRKKGQYVQNSSSIHEKYALRPISLSKLCLAQFSTSYDTCPVTAKCAKKFKKAITSNGVCK